MPLTTTACMQAPWNFSFREVNLPETPESGQVRLRIDACGICGSDVGGHGLGKDPRPFGHEIAGTIEALGPDCRGTLTVGQKVVVESSGFCGTCEVCRNGRVDLCAKAPNLWGQPALGMSTLMHIPACSCVPYEGLDPIVACLAEPAGVAYDLVRVADIRLGDRVCVVGPGPIGLMALALAQHAGAVEAVCIGLPGSTRRLQLAQQLGAQVIANSLPLNELKDFSNRFDHVLMTAPVAHIGPGLSLLALEGKLTYLGLAHGGNNTVSFNGDDFHFRKLQLRASFAAPGIFLPRVLNFLKTGLIPGRDLVSHVLPLSRIAEGMNITRNDRENAVKVVITPS